MSLQDKTVFITGASAGIGEACARQFAALGCRLVLAARRLERLKDLARDIESEFPTQVLVLELDVRNQKQIKSALNSLKGDWAAIEILVNNAGLARGYEPLQQGSTDDWDQMIDTNVKGLLYVTRAIVPGMIKRGGGHIINIGSIAGSEVYPNGTVYCSSKAAVEAISRGLRMDLLGTSIRVTNIEPGMVETEFSTIRFHGDQDRADGVYQGVVPLVADDVADTVVYAATRPPHVNIDSIMLKCVAQASATMVAREE